MKNDANSRFTGSTFKLLLLVALLYIGYLGKCALAVLLILITAGIFVLWTPAYLKRWEVKHTYISADC